MYLAKLAVDETGRGIYEDKAIKNMYYNSEWMRCNSDWKMSAKLTRITRQVLASVGLKYLHFGSRGEEVPGQTRVRRQCLDRVLCGLMHCYAEPGARARLHGILALREH